MSFDFFVVVGGLRSVSYYKVFGWRFGFFMGWGFYVYLQRFVVYYVSQLWVYVRGRFVADGTICIYCVRFCFRYWGLFRGYFVFGMFLKVYVDCFIVILSQVDLGVFRYRFVVYLVFTYFFFRLRMWSMVFFTFFGSFVTVTQLGFGVSFCGKRMFIWKEYIQQLR